MLRPVQRSTRLGVLAVEATRSRTAAAASACPRLLSPQPSTTSPSASKLSSSSSSQSSEALVSLSNTSAPSELRSSWPKPAFDVAAMRHLLDHDNHEMRDKFRALLADPLFKPRYNLTLEEERELALQRLTRICREGLISVLDFNDNPLR